MKRTSFIQLIILLFATTVAIAIPFFLIQDIDQDAGGIAGFKTRFQEVVNNTVEQTQKVVITPEPLRQLLPQPSNDLTVNGILSWTNSHRQTAGESSLVLNTQLNQAAQAKVDDMFANQYFEHISSTGLGPSHWVESSGYSYIAVGENLALGNYEDDQALVQAWMDSPGHRENILNGNFEQIGIAAGEGTFEGEQTWLAVQMFAKPLSSCPEIDEDLDQQIKNNKNQLAVWEDQIKDLQAKIDDEKPKNRSSQQAIDEYNALVSEYNNLANTYNNLIEQTKTLVNQYNQQVAAFNACAG